MAVIEFDPELDEPEDITPCMTQTMEEVNPDGN